MCAVSTIPELILRVSFVVERDGPTYHAYAPALTGLHVDGKTQDEAIANLIDAIRVYLRSLSIHNDPLPIGPDLRVQDRPQIPEGAFLSNLTVQWPSLQMSGVS
jgi:predicted RNase H-like HicB family nuclease